MKPTPQTIKRQLDRQTKQLKQTLRAVRVEMELRSQPAVRKAVIDAVRRVNDEADAYLRLADG